ncbi:hypothetical protein scyTo_0022828, partial [Scyliorhinus torazame]|nr:hypothetical protein [Scyliorhinus torazame]
MHQVQGALSQACGKTSAVCKPKTLLDTIMQPEKREEDTEQ